MVKQFSTARNTQRDTLSYIKKGIGRREIEVTSGRKGGVKRGENSLASNQIPKCSTAQNTQRNSQSYAEKRRGMKEIEVTWRRKGRVKRGESNQASSQIPPFEEIGLLFWVPGVLCQHSEVVLWNLFKIQMIFWWICGRESGFPILFLCHLETAPSISFFIEVQFTFSFYCDKLKNNTTNQKAHLAEIQLITKANTGT